MKIAVIGGGIAGCMSVVHLSHHLSDKTIYHIYDPKIPAIGVGEGTLPSFRKWLHTISDLNFSELQALGGVTLKRGIHFEGWGKRHAQFRHYFAEDALAYHISAAQICPLLAQYSTATRLDQHLLAIQQAGAKARLTFTDAEPLLVDLVLDARGFPSISDETLVPLTVIPTQAALLRRSSVTTAQEATRAVARPHGWIFVIPLTTYTSYGYIYNQQISTQTAVTADFDAFFAAEQLTDWTEGRVLPFPNYRQKHFFDGVVYKIGNAAAFLEPLEATAIGVTLYQLQALTDWLKQPENLRKDLVAQINRDIGAAVEAIGLFVGWHYAKGSQYDTPFWQFAQANFAAAWEGKKTTAVGQTFDQLVKAGGELSNAVAVQQPIFFGGFEHASFVQVGQGIGYYPPQSPPSATNQTTDQPFSIALLKQAQQVLEQALLDHQPPVTLRQWLSPEQIQYLFQVELATLIKMGGTTIPIDQLLQVAQTLVARGEMAVETLPQMRRMLDRVAMDLYAANAWHPNAALWWHPLPPLSPVEAMWQRLQQHEWVTLPPATELQKTFTAASSGPDWLMLPSLFVPAFIQQIHPHLENAFQNGQLPLVRGGIGSQDTQQTQRTDWVWYLTGLEADIWREVPALAVLVQWCRQYLATYLAGDEPIFSPQTAMLSRYPAGATGYAPHIDNPRGTNDNGRALTLVIYLNAPDEPCIGGEIAVWDKDKRTTEPPTAIMAATAGAAILFNARTIPHQVCPLGAGPARWALSLWFNNMPQAPTPTLPVPSLSLTDSLLHILNPPLPPDMMLFHELPAHSVTGQLIIRSRQTASPRVGLVTTVYRVGTALDQWCAYHFALGIAHIVLIFDQWQEANEQADAAHLRTQYAADQLTIWSTEHLQHTRWPALPPDESTAELLKVAQLGKSTQAVAARQTLNATIALQAAQRETLGGAPLDWLLHLDSDELFYVEGAGRGGANVVEHFATLQAENYACVRYLNHELLLPSAAAQLPRFKINPALAQARLGKVGWQAMVSHLQMASDDQRPYFHGYTNGKTAVFVPQGIRAAGVHSWYTAEQTRCTLAGPTILHFRQPSTAQFRQKYQAIAAFPVATQQQLFPPSAIESKAVALIQRLQNQGADDKTLDQALNQLYATAMQFSALETNLLAEANLLFTPSSTNMAMLSPLVKFHAMLARDERRQNLVGQR